MPHRGKRNEPSFAVEVVRKIAAIKELPVEEVASQIVQNAKKVFSPALSADRLQ
jgi:TatD DNase family protein